MFKAVPAIWELLGYCLNRMNKIEQTWSLHSKWGETEAKK